MRRERSAGVLRLAAFALGVALLCLPARAAPTTDGFALDRYRPAEAGSDWFALESLDLRGGARPALSLVADVAYRPLVLYTLDGDERVPLVDGQFFYHAQAALNLWGRLRLSLGAPLLVYSQGGRGTLSELGGVSNVPISSSDGSGLGDVRAALDLRLFGAYPGPFSLAVGGRVYAASGSEQHFTSDGRARFEGRLMGAGQLGWFAYAAHLGALVHGERDDFAGEAFGTDLVFAAALGVRLAAGRVQVGPELFGETVISDSGDGFLYRATTPIEAVLGAKLRLGESVRLGAAAGRGLTRGMGTARFRFLASLDWFPAPRASADADADAAAARDRDADGVSDEADACPDAAGPARPWGGQRSGCPDAGDADGDGITDDVDACPSERGPPSGDGAMHGCAPSDRDLDGVVDSIDACPDAAGPTGEALRSGCPADADSDGINDADDACPGAAGPRDRARERHGCPLARLEADAIAIAEQVQFATGSARILVESDELLRALAEVLLRHPEVELVSVEGHTDAEGSPSVNEKLSRDRALSVVMRLVENGVTARRLTARGFGAQNPIADNATPEGRRNNRRVEFRILRARTNPIREE